jgi:glycosyltransferase involved in cell wall biosynthesis
VEALFLIALVGSLYSYLGYPLLMLVLGALAGRPGVAAQPGYRPTLSVIITAHNEVGRIAAKVADTLELFEGRQFEIIVVSDASNDGTDEAVRAPGDERVRLVRQDERKGKESGQRLGIEAATGEILVFSDVATRIAPGSVDALIECFSDPSVGAVSSEDRFISSDGTIAGEGLYVRYEMWLRRLESRLAGLVGLSGSFFAVRRALCGDWRTDVPSDFTVALTCARHGMRAVSHPGVIGIYPDLKEPADEYARKRRTVIRGMAGLAAAREVLNPFRHGLFAFEVWSHKVLRWAVPWFLLLLLLSTVALAPGSAPFSSFLALQLAGYALVIAAWRLPGLRRIALIRIGYYFVLVNLAMADALLRFLRGERIVTWNPSRR